MNVAWWPHTTNRAVASYRLRCWQIIEEIRRRGLSADLYRPWKVPQVLVMSKRYDATSLQAARALRDARGTRLVLDLCDNHFHADTDDTQWKRRADALRATVRSMDLIVASTPTLAEVVRAEAGPEVPIEVVGDAAEAPYNPGRLPRMLHGVAERRLNQLRAELQRQPVLSGRRLVWFGNHGSAYAEGGMSDLVSLRKALEEAHREAPLSLTVVSNHRAKFDQLTAGWAVPVHYVEWHPNTVSRALCLHDVAVVPVRTNPFTMCKTNNRVATATLHGLAVAADAIPSYRDLGNWIVLDDWETGLRRLMDDAQYRASCVASGKTLLAAHWSLKHVTDQWLHALSRIQVT